MIKYIAVNIGDQLKGFSAYSPYRCLILTIGGETPQWRNYVSKILVDTGCLYMMAWGNECSLWDDFVDEAAIEKHSAYNDLKSVPDHKFILTTWHGDETLEEVLHFSKYTAIHSYDDDLIENIIILDIGYGNRKEEILKLYAEQN